MAKLYFRYGAMNSGKTTAIIQVAHNYEERGMHVILIKPLLDSKWWDSLVSRLGVSREVDILLDRAENVEIVLDLYEKRRWKIDCILVDEVQFLQPRQIDSFFWIAVTKNIPVICYGLRSDFLMQAFPASERLMILAHTIEELKTICRCGKKAIFNMRLQNNIPVFSGDQIAIDWDLVTYESVCGSCYLQYRQKWEQESAIEQIIVKPKARRINKKTMQKKK